MPEMPEQIQGGLASLELSADKRTPPPGTPASHGHVDKPLPQQNSQYGRAPPEYSGQPDSSYQSIQHSDSSQPQQTSQAPPPPPPQHHNSRSNANVPNFSAFPKLPFRTSNIPPTDEEREITLENARISVLGSTDPEEQLVWAEDALRYVDVSIEHEGRMSKLHGPRASTPPVEHQIRVDALNIVSFLADQHHPKAEFLRGMWQEFGKFGHQEDKPAAFHSYRRSAENGYARAEYRMGMQYESTNEPVQALQHYTIGESLKDTASCYRMGMMAMLGQLSQPQDFQRAIHLIRQAADDADENCPQGAYVYGMLQAKELPQIKVPDIFLPVDIVSARLYIEKAAYLGFSKAQLKMGSAYELCTLGCEFNPALSMHYNALAARQGEPEAEMAISKWFLCGYEGVFHKNEELAFQFAQRAAQSQLAMAEFGMGYFHEIGISVPVNLTLALDWYRKAAANGNKDATGRIDGIMKANTLSKKDHEIVAVSRIKSQHGSMRGQRPARFSSPLPPLPPVIHEHVDMPNPVVPPPRASTVASLPDPQIRPASAAPYPVDDRPTSVAPYPIDDRPGRWSNSPMPPSNPKLAPRPNSVQSQRQPPRNYGNLPPRPTQGPTQALDVQRQYQQTIASSNGPAGRIPPSSRHQLENQGLQDQRHTSGPLPPRPGPGPGKPLPNAKLNAASLQKLDIGYVAPLDVNAPPKLQDSGYRKPSRVPTIDISSPSSVYSPRVSAPAPAPPPFRDSNNRLVARPGSASRSSKHDQIQAQAQAPASNSTLMSGGLSRPQTTPPAPIATKIASHPTPKLTPKPTPATSMTSTSSGKTQGSTTPGKGPKTFEEMGVPQGKHEGDCIVM